MLAFGRFGNIRLWACGTVRPAVAAAAGVRAMQLQLGAGLGRRGRRYHTEATASSAIVPKEWTLALADTGRMGARGIGRHFVVASTLRKSAGCGVQQRYSLITVLPTAAVR